MSLGSQEARAWPLGRALDSLLLPGRGWADPGFFSSSCRLSLFARALWRQVRKWEKIYFDFSAGNFCICFLLFLFHFCLYNKSSLYNFLYWFFLVFHICLMISNDWSLPDVISLEKQCAQMSLITFSIADRLCGPKSLLHLVQYWDCQKRRFIV